MRVLPSSEQFQNNPQDIRPRFLLKLFSSSSQNMVSESLRLFKSYSHTPGFRFIYLSIVLSILIVY